MVTNCKLCNENKPLIRAHIIPEFLYRLSNLYGGETKRKGRISVASIQNEDFNIGEKDIPCGIYDKNILCKSCDNFINVEYENYSKYLLQDCFTLIPNFSNEIFIIKNVNYNKFKLFLLSIFWRASISERKEFKSMKFRDNIETMIKELVRSNNAIDKSDFPIFIFYLNIPKLLEQSIFSPIRINNNGVFLHEFMANGFLFCMFDNDSDVPESLNDNKFIDNGQLKIPILRENSSIKILNKWFGLVNK